MQVWQCVQGLDCVHRSSSQLTTSGLAWDWKHQEQFKHFPVQMILCPLCPFQSKFWKYIFDILTSGWSLGLTIYTPLRCLGWKVKFWRWMAKIKMNVTFLNEILFWMNGTELVLRICTSYSWPVTILQMICTAPSISDNSQQSTRKYKILCPHIKSTSPKQHSDIFYSPSTTETIKLRFGNIYIKFKFVCWGLLLWLVPPFLCKTAATNRWLILAIIDWNQVPAPSHCP